MITIEQMIQREVLCCVSSLVSTLAGAYGCGFGDNSDDSAGQTAGNLFAQASELVAPVPDYEEAAIQAWTPFKDQFDVGCWRDDKDGVTFAGSAEQLCNAYSIEPYEWEVYEHWAVSAWFAEKLQTQGERVDTDFAGLSIWARATTGQAISMDGCIQRIYANMTAPAGASA